MNPLKQIHIIAGMDQLHLQIISTQLNQTSMWMACQGDKEKSLFSKMNGIKPALRALKIFGQVWKEQRSCKSRNGSDGGRELVQVAAEPVLGVVDGDEVLDQLIVRLADAAAQAHQGLKCVVAEPLGLHPLMATILAQRLDECLSSEASHWRAPIACAPNFC